MTELENAKVEIAKREKAIAEAQSTVEKSKGQLISSKLVRQYSGIEGLRQRQLAQSKLGVAQQQIEAARSELELPKQQIAEYEAKVAAQKLEAANIQADYDKAVKIAESSDPRAVFGLKNERQREYFRAIQESKETAAKMITEEIESQTPGLSVEEKNKVYDIAKDIASGKITSDKAELRINDLLNQQTITSIEVPKIEEIKQFSVISAVEKPKGFLERKSYEIRTSKEDNPLLGVAQAGIGTLILTKEFIKHPIKTPTEIGKSIFSKGKEIGRFLISKPSEQLPAPFQQAGITLRERPTYSLGLIGGEITIGKGLGVTGEVLKTKAITTVTKLSPKYVSAESGFIKIPSNIKGEAINIEVSYKLPRMPLKEQVRLIGKEITPVSAQRDLFGVVRNNIEINKPIPVSGGKVISPDVLEQIELMKQNKLSVSQIAELERKVQQTGAKGILETSFFADPLGRIRPSRLGLTKENKASIVDILSGDVTTKTRKPQALYFARQKVEKLPKDLIPITEKIARGESITEIEKARLLKFQLTPSGKFKPIGFISRESEVTLAPGEIIKKKRTQAVTLIKGKDGELFRVPIILTEIAQDKLTNPTLSLLEKYNLGKATTSEINTLEKSLYKETGISYSLEERPYISKSELFSKTISTLPSKEYGKVSSNVITVKPASYGVSSKVLSKKPISLEFVKQNVKYSVPPNKVQEFSYNYVPSKISKYEGTRYKPIVYKLKQKAKTIPITYRKINKTPISKSFTKQETNILYKVLTKRKGRWLEIARGLPESRAKLAGVSYTRRTLGRSFRLEEQGFGNVPDISFDIPNKLYRPPKIGSKLPKNTFVQIKALSRGTGEVPEIMAARKSKARRLKLL